MRSLLLVGGGILIGAGLSWYEAVSHAELKAKNKYDEMAETLQRVYDFRIQRAESKVWETMAEAPVVEEADLADTSPDAIKVGGEMTVETPISPDYLAQAEHYAPQETFVSDVSPWSVAFIEPEEYEDEDGRPKERIDIFMTDGEPMFMMDGEQVENWAELIGDDILREFYKRIAPGQEPVLYVRNHKRDEDFEVVQVIP